MVAYHRRMELAPPRVAAGSRTSRGDPWLVLAAAGVAFVGIAPVAAGQGGYFPSAWGWLGLGASWVAAFALVLRRDMVVSRLELAALAGAAGLTLWTAASLLWTSSHTLSVLQLERTVAYVVVLAAALLVCRRQSAFALLVGAWMAIIVVAAYALATHLLPERFGYYTDQIQTGRLFQPIGYWNALGIFCAMGLMLALGLTDRPGNVALRVASGASAPLLAATTYFTFSRGAWLAAGLAFACVIAATPARLRYLTTALIVAPVPVAAVAYAASLGPLVALRATPQQVEGPGARAAAVLVTATLLEAVVVALFVVCQRRVRPSALVRRIYAGVLVVAVLAAAGGVIDVTGSPLATFHRLRGELTTSTLPPTDLNNRLLSVSLTGRQYLWETAVDDYETHSLLGSGAGTYAPYWLEHRTVAGFNTNAHELYLETLAELGIGGLILLVVLLGAPLVAAVRRRDSPLVPTALGVYLAFLFHVTVDWDWQVPAVTTVALIAGAVLLVQARGSAPVLLGRPVRWAAGVAVVLVAILCGLGLAGNHALSTGLTALGGHRYRAALSDAMDAHRYAPWSDQPYILSGRAHLALHDRIGAVRSFRAAVRKDDSDWVAWQWLARATTGPDHAAATKRLLALDPLYDVRNGRP